MLRRYTFKVHFSKRRAMRRAQEEAAMRFARMAAELRNALIELCYNTYCCRCERAGAPPPVDPRVVAYAVRDRTKAEAREIIASYRRGLGGSMRRSEPQWHKPERPWPQERKEKLRATMRRREEEKRARRKAPAKPRKPPRQASVRALALAELTGEITALRWACPEWAEMPTHMQHRVADGLVKSLAALMRGDAKAPRFKRTDRANRLPLGAKGYKLAPQGRERSRAGRSRASARNWKLTVTGLPGHMRAVGEFPAEVRQWKTADLIFHAGSWWLSVCVEIERERSHGAEEVTVRLGLIDEFAHVEGATGPRWCPGEGVRACAESPHRFHDLAGGSDNAADAVADGRAGLAGIGHIGARSDNAADAVADGRDQDGCRNPRRLPPDNAADAVADGRVIKPFSIPQSKRPAEPVADAAADALKAERDRRYRRGSRRWRRAARRIARIEARAARRRRERHHLWTSQLVRCAGAITVIAPDIPQFTKSGRGDARNWGANVKLAAALNRHILGQAPMLAVSMLQYKAEEAGIRCDLIEDDAPEIAVGRDHVAAGKAQRRLRRAIRKDAA